MLRLWRSVWHTWATVGRLALRVLSGICLVLGLLVLGHVGLLVLGVGLLVLGRVGGGVFRSDAAKVIPNLYFAVTHPYRGGG